MQQIAIKKKICLLGDPAVGKTSLIRRFVTDSFDDKYLATIGTKVTKTIVNVSLPELNAVAPVTLMIWDVLGQKDYGDMYSNFYRGADGAFIVCDPTRQETVRNLWTWYDSISKTVGVIPYFFIVNKIDLLGGKPYSLGDGIAQICTSAKTGENVQNAFNSIAATLARRSLNLA